MCWEKVCEFLTERLSGIPENPIPEEHLSTILKQLHSSKRGIRLATCLAVDIKFNAVDPEQLCGLLRQIDPNEDICTQFHTLAAPAPNGVRGQISPLDRTDKYVRVINLEAAHTYYLSPNMPYLTIDIPDLADSAKELRAWQDEGAPVLNRTYSGYRNCVWVTRLSEIEPILPSGEQSEEQKMAQATQLSNYLGRPCQGDIFQRHLWAFCYPENFCIVCRRPNCCDATWDMDVPFLSADQPLPEWGKTHPCTRGARSLPERVHSGYEGYLQFFSIREVGIAEPLQVDWDAVIESGYQRFNSEFPHS